MSNNAKIKFISVGEESLAEYYNETENTVLKDSYLMEQIHSIQYFIRHFYI